uniref:RTR1-type domain-containing protein n=1 Tax=Anopheles dirus TaxID=7168 RepID=A0A182NES9_9DIPT
MQEHLQLCHRDEKPYGCFLKKKNYLIIKPSIYKKMWGEELNVFTKGHTPKDPATKVNRGNLPRRARNFSKEQLQKALRRKKECNDKAQRVVETLIEPGRTEDELLVMVKDINQCHMEDIVQERAIVKICGYVLCDNELTDIPKQKYTISATKNKVYDITERKNFCSGDCYKASNYIKQQMLTSPLWLRDQEDIPNFRLFSGRQLVYRETDVKKPLQPGDIAFGDLKIVERTMAQQVQQVFKAALAKTAGQRAMSTGVIGTLDGAAGATTKHTVAQSSGLHMSVQRSYPLAAALPLPPNIDASETRRFSPLRSRDINATALLTHQSLAPSAAPTGGLIDVTVDMGAGSVDPHVESYDCTGAVSLNSTMQSNVPSPFGGMHKFTHLNMPGGAWAQESKFLSHELNSSHYTNLRQEVRSDWSSYEDRPIKPEGMKKSAGRSGSRVLGEVRTGTFLATLSRRHFSDLHSRRAFSLSSTHLLAICSTLNNKSPATQANKDSGADAGVQNSKGNTEGASEEVPVSRKDRLKKAIKEYGSTVLVFHVSISLASLGTCYLLVSSGIDMVSLLDRMGWGDSALAGKAGAGAGTFVIAYAIHKVFAPVRISITLGATPLIVRYLRRKGILKPPAAPTTSASASSSSSSQPPSGKL